MTKKVQISHSREAAQAKARKLFLLNAVEKARPANPTWVSFLLKMIGR